MHVLDNPVWHALRGPHRPFAEGGERAVRYRPDVALFSALPDEAVAEDWPELAAVLGPNPLAVLFRRETSPPEDWEELFRIPTLQMIGETVAGASSVLAKRLGDADVPEMLDLAKRTRPGPFVERTIELGSYLGIRENGSLVAMAGERMRLPGWTEISAVCTEESHRGRGLGTELVRSLVASIVGRGETPFLHAVADNVGAIRLYEALGFRTRHVFDVLVLRPRA